VVVFSFSGNTRRLPSAFNQPSLFHIVQRCIDSGLAPLKKAFGFPIDGLDKPIGITFLCL
jgi:hypothetical protein